MTRLAAYLPAFALGLAGLALIAYGCTDHAAGGRLALPVLHQLYALAQQ